MEDRPETRPRRRSRAPPTSMSSAQPRDRATMRDVAALAGVSLKTVLRVINREPGVSSALVAQVERAVAQLDYRPNMSASSLRRGDGKTAAVAAVLEDLANPFSASLLRALEDTAHERGVLIFAGSVDEDPQRSELVRAFTMRRADGIVIARPATTRLPRRRQPRRYPVVFVDRPARGLSADAVVADNVSGPSRPCATSPPTATAASPTSATGSPSPRRGSGTRATAKPASTWASPPAPTTRSTTSGPWSAAEAAVTGPAAPPTSPPPRCSPARTS